MKFRMLLLYSLIIFFFLFCLFDSLCEVKMIIKRVSFAKPLAKAKHMVKTVRNMFDKKQKVPFQPLTPDMLG